MYGPPLSPTAKKVMLLGSGELGKEVILEAQRLGVETVAVDRYANAPAMQVAHRSYVIDMADGAQLRDVIKAERPDLIVPEIEAIATGTLVELEQEGFHVIPTARATQLTMDREGIRRFAAEELNLPTARYEFANTLDELRAAVEKIGTPCVIKPIMSSSGKGQSVCRSLDDVEKVWNYAMSSGRVRNSRVIVEEFIQFDSEITLLTVRSSSGTAFCAPIGHVQKDGDYIESWQPHVVTEAQRQEAERIAKTITDALGGCGVFGVELFIAPDKIYFSEVSPRPHDTGLVTLVTQDLSEFALHARAILGFPVPDIHLVTPGASRAVKSPIASDDYQIRGISDALRVPRTQVRFFGKPSATVGRRLAVVLSGASDTETARANATRAASALNIVRS
ncbi:formate-dependent phosphoribosylglycinamide formyltransferase [Alicyclobacillus fastidiosus]|uniref:Formate-dependent phosphoribosylglycinamide formyltransferase n=1 Tax=Alicyclobacillus fastidiosus TaxID=392011 RepID=A0ABY6ZMR6_9BACL|nr:formate-dependent phosphoribosylglycinamide formyltransferase [Alicyclobacillus fastidiosus]WAH43863.1 formate-dependent phosphoribosylglycinamide formyltransferase [Alicyclobacillus fastidiosus]GMA60101.1 phosphoribosylglycinamide formyltransferase 2 [Alicyclobacillus fastidiosus]